MNENLKLHPKSEKLHLVVKPRKMITENRYVGEAKGTSLTLGASKALNMLIAELSVQELDLEQKYVSIPFRFKEYWESRGVTRLSGKHVELITQSLTELASKEVFLTLLDPKTMRYRKIQTRWISLIEKTGIEGNDTPDAIWVDMPTALIRIMQADKDVLSIPMEYSVGLTSAYAYTAREQFLGMGIYDTPIRLSIDELAEMVDAHEYKAFADFRVKVIEKIVSDINTNAKDISVQVEYEKTGRRVTHVIFTVHKTFPEIATNVVEEIPTRNAELMDRIWLQIGYEDLRSVYGDVAKTAAMIILSAYEHLECDGDSFAEKFGLTGKEMKKRLDSLTQLDIVQGLDSLREGSMNQKASEILVLDSFLKAAEPKKKEKNLSARTEAKNEIQRLIGYEILKRCHAGSKEYQTALDDLVAALTSVMTTSLEYIQVGKKETLRTESARKEIRNYLTQDAAIHVMERYLANLEDIRCAQSVKGRRNYLKICIFNEMRNPTAAEPEEMD